MIFTCPTCRAGHNVPVVTIPQDGVEIVCRDCGGLFLVSRPVTSEAAAPFVDCVPDQDQDQDQNRDPVHVGVSALFEDVARPMAADAATVRVASFSHAEFVENEPSEAGPHRYYAEFTPSDFGPSQALGNGGGQDAREACLVRRLAERLNAARLGTRLGWVLVPTVLGGALMLASLSSRDTPSRLGVPSHARTAAGAGSGAGPDFGAVDVEAGPGHFFVQVGDGAVRGEPNDGSAPFAKLESGRLVRELWREGEWSVVLAEPRGPVGFIRRALLGRRPPISALARAVDISRCEPRRDRRVDLCLQEGRRQVAACGQRCGALTGRDADEDGLRSVRCVQACQAAWKVCSRRCRSRSVEAAR